MREQDFMADIIADGESNTTRLVFADWLEEQGDVDRAEFIRLQCLGDDKEREYELLEKNYSAWCRPYERKLIRIVFQRGLIYFARVLPDGLKNLPETLEVLQLSAFFDYGDRLVTGMQQISVRNIKEIHCCKWGYDTVSYCVSKNENLSGACVLAYDDVKVARDHFVWHLNEYEMPKIFKKNQGFKMCKCFVIDTKNTHLVGIKIIAYDNFSGEINLRTVSSIFNFACPSDLWSKYTTKEFTSDKAVASFYNFGLGEMHVN